MAGVARGGGMAAVIAGEFVLEAVGDALDDEGGDLFVESQGLGDVEADGGVPGGGRGGEAGDVGGGVASGGEEVGVDDDEGGALGDATVEGLRDGGRGEFHMGGFDDGQAGNAAEEGGDFEELVIGGGHFGAVVNDDDAKRVVGKSEHAAPKQEDAGGPREIIAARKGRTRGEGCCNGGRFRM
jgi:hypothetical protein